MTGRQPDEVELLLRDRRAARDAADFERADALREEIRALGWEVQDSPHGSTARPALPEAPAPTGYARPQDLASLLDESPSVDASLQVVATDHGDDLRRFLGGLATHLPSVSWELVLVANAPSYDLAAMLAETPLPMDASMLLTTERLGWADAVNLGLRRSRGNITLMLDTSLEPVGDFVAPLLVTFDDPGVGIAGGWGVNSAQARQFEAASSGEVDAVEAYCLAVRRDVLRDVGLFDPHYRFYRNADLDFSFTAREAGWHAVVVADLPLRRHEHRGYASLPKAERDRLSKRNFYRFLKRWGDRRDLLLHPDPPAPGSRQAPR